MPERTCLGSALHPDDQRYVLGAYVHRFTREHRPAWAAKDSPVQFDSDADWLAHTKFAVRVDGRLDMRFTTCQAHPTWPDIGGLA